MRPRTVGHALASALVWGLWTALVVLWTPLVAAVTLVTVWWDPRRRIAGRVFRYCAVVAIHVHPLWSVRIEGRLPPSESGPYVVVSNHESLADVVIVGCLPREMKWLSKRDVLLIPFLGLMMLLVGDVPVRRGDAESRSRAYDRLRRWLVRGMSVLIFPEGTRSPTRDLLPFRNGAFRLAVETRTPVLPIALSGTRDAIRKGSLLFRPATAVVRILEPVPVGGLGPDAVESLRDEVRDRIDAARKGVRPSRL